MAIIPIMPADTPKEDLNIPQPPPKGDEQKATKYISQLVNLLTANKLEVFHTDLSKFDPGAMQDHYRMDLKDYQIEISHSKQPNTGADSYVLLFTNFKNIREGSCEKIIMAYIHLDEEQFIKFRQVAESQIEKRRAAEEQKRFEAVMQPVDQVLDNLFSGEEETREESKPVESLEQAATPHAFQPPQPEDHPTFGDSLDLDTEDPFKSEQSPTHSSPMATA